MLDHLKYGADLLAYVGGLWAAWTLIFILSQRMINGFASAVARARFSYERAHEDLVERASRLEEARLNSVDKSSKTEEDKSDDVDDSVAAPPKPRPKVLYRRQSAVVDKDRKE